jgi:hypothetical protein
MDDQAPHKADMVKIILVFLVVLLAGTTFVFYTQSQVTKAQLDEAKTVNGMVIDLIRLQGGACMASKSDIAGTGKCLEPLLMAKDFKQDDFSQPDTRKGTQGFLVIKNINRAAYASSNFTFTFNREVVQQGCPLPGDIGYNIVCRFDFNEFCDAGDVLEVSYTRGKDTAKVFTKTC